ncbi:MAG: protein-tyrosine-phosphatase, partial [Flavobacteriales bacterium]|nr:protein-tyrosine-phosphatase [Flavobacteriales bacterium]
DRKSVLEDLAAYIKENLSHEKKVKLIFICTHNSRRSHFGQIWAETAASYFGIDNLEAYSGGTEATAFNPRAVAAVERAGFTIDKASGENPRYQVSLSEESKPMVCFSKKFDHSTNPTQKFAAVMTCSDADENCPFVPGAEYRARITYNDPKAADGTLEESLVYDKRCAQIAREMFYVFSKV